MITVIRFILTLVLIILIVPQTNTENMVLRAFNNTKFFKNYGEATSFLRWVTWLSIVLYLFVTYVATIS
jgi:preprotein translocase subunit SecG